MKGRAWFDEISILASEPAMTPLARDINLLINPDFSQGLTGWNFFSVSGTPKLDWGVTNVGGGHDSSLYLTQPQPVDKVNYSGFFQTINNLYRTNDNAILTRMGEDQRTGRVGLAQPHLLLP